MEGQASINGKDIFKTFGALLIKGAYEALLTPPPMKEYIINESRIEHGIRYVATSLTARTQQRELSIGFFIEGTSQSDYLQKYEAFMNELTNGQIVLQVPLLKKSFKLVYLSCSKYGYYGLRKGKFVVKFIEPNTQDRQEL